MVNRRRQQHLCPRRSRTTATARDAATRVTSSAPGDECVYTRNVVAADPCPNAACTPDTGTPAAINVDA